MNRPSVALSAQDQGMAPGVDPFRIPLPCIGSLATLGPAKVVGLVNRCPWIADWPTDFGGPAVFGEAIDATVTGRLQGSVTPLFNVCKRSKFGGTIQ